MNWWTKLAMPLPSATGMPSDEEAVWTKRKFNDLEDSRAKDIEKEHGPLSYLGHGSYGIAYDSPSQNVVKLTTDRSEVEAAMRQKKEKCPCLVKVFDVQILADENETGRLYWKIVAEKVTPLTEQDKLRMGPLIRCHEQSFHPYYGNTGFPSFSEVTEELKNYVAWQTNRDGFAIGVKAMYPKFRRWNDCMKTHNLVCEDLAANNIGYNTKGELVLLDLGFVKRVSK